MPRRFVSIWFRHLMTDWLTRRQPELNAQPIVIVRRERGRMAIVAANATAEYAGIYTGMSVADAMALNSSLQTFDDKPDFEEKLLDVIADWLIRFTPYVSVDLPDGIILDITGCAHLKGGEVPFLKEMVIRLRALGYDARAAMADTQGAAWAVARFGTNRPLIGAGMQRDALASLPPAALRLPLPVTDKLYKFGLRTIGDLYTLNRASLTKRFGRELLLKLDQALGEVQEITEPKKPVEPYEERSAFPEGVASPENIAAVLKNLLAILCCRLELEQKGIRAARLECHRLDGKVETIQIGTSLPTHDAKHLFKLFENKIEKIEPDLGIEVFILAASHVDHLNRVQGGLLDDADGPNDKAIAELIDKTINRIPMIKIRRYLPHQSYWPERSIRPTTDIAEKPDMQWQTESPQPFSILKRPEPIDVTALVPDYPPLQFRYKGKTHRVCKADGPQRLQREWWKDQGALRDYYSLEDQDGNRYWVFRSGHYQHGEPSSWFLHGFFV